MPGSTWVKIARKVNWFDNFELTQYNKSQLTNVYFSEDSKFTYYDPFYISYFPGFNSKYRFVNVSVQFLLSPESLDSTRCCYYYSGEVTNSPFLSLSKSFPISSIFRNPKRIEGLNINIWITQPDITATLHYDAVNNLFIQVQGSKRVVLYPPRMVGELYVHGRLHPHACQSRLDQYCPSQRTFSTRNRADYCSEYTDVAASTIEPAKSVDIRPYSIVMRRHTQEVFEECWDVGDGIVLDLNAGDVLLIPPFWFHKTISQSASVSLSLWWETRETEVFDNMLNHPLPFESNWSAPALVHAAMRFIWRLLERSDELMTAALHSPRLSGREVRALVMTLLSQRYWEDLRKFAMCTADSDAFVDYELEHCQLLTEMLPVGSEVDGSVKDKMITYAEQVASIAVRGLVGADRTQASFPHVEDDESDVDEDQKELEVLQRQMIYDYGIRLDSEIDEDEDTISSSDTRIDNLRAVLSMKLCDYIEEVFYTVCSLLPTNDGHADKVLRVVAMLRLFANSQ
eukprot:gene29398-35487_t